MYSASVNKSAVMLCLFEDQQIASSANVKI